MLSKVKFKSEAFKIKPGEDEETNPGIYGIELANWVKDTLPKYGVATKEVLPEDFAWLVTIQSKDFRPWIGCSNIEDQENTWLCIVTIEGGFLKKLFGQANADEELSRIDLCFREMLTKESIISDIHWYEDA